MQVFSGLHLSIKTKLVLAFFTMVILVTAISILSTSLSFCNNLALSCQGLNIDAYRPYLELKIMKKNLFFSLVLILSFVSFLIFYITQRLISPIKNLSKAVTRIQKGNYNFALDYNENGSELDELAKTFNEMIISIREQEKEKYEFITGASHQFRTPLSKLQLEANELRVQIKKIPKARGLLPLINEIETSSIASTAIINDLFKLLELGENYHATHLTKIDVNELLVHIVSSFNQRIQQKKLEVEVDIPKNLKIMVNEGNIKTVFLNLIDNAITYSKTKSSIIIKAKKTNNQVLFQITDSGIGIPDEDQIHIFTKFFRAKNSYSEKNVGTGLGLVIVKKIIDGHDGRIMFESHQDEGTTFYFSLPS
ncbi:HAMP domain-containing histidine kinase [Patescibacteria group bacterium]|nr:HAMP domain-containing histidine kinase [Patescibacteria group bacterium]